MKLDEIAEINPWWKDKESINNDDKIKAAQNSGIRWDRGQIFTYDKGIFSLRGPRQTGKTTWIKFRIRELLSRGIDPRSILYLSCDKISDFKELANSLSEFKEWAKQDELFIFLDEISFVEEWQRGLKYLVDKGDLKKSTIIVTGSSSLDITKSVERLPGRTGTGKRHFLFYPMTFREYVEARGQLQDLLIKKDWIGDCQLYIKEINGLVIDYCKSGGISSAVPVFTHDKNIPTYIYDTYAAWITGDLAKAEKRENLSRQIIHKIIESYVSSLNWTNIAKVTAAESHSTIADYVDTMEKLFFLQYVYTYAAHKKGAGFARNKKIYFADPFLFFLGIFMTRNIERPFEFCNEFLLSKENQGKLIEGIVLNSIVAELNRRTQRDDFDYKNYVFFWSDGTGEVDFVVSMDEKEPIGIEVKWRNKPQLKRYPFKRSLILTEKEYNPEKGFIPVGVFLLDPGRWI